MFNANKCFTKFLKRFSCLLLTLWINSALADSIDTYVTKEKINKLETYIKQGMKDLDLPGLAIAIVEPGKPLFMKGYGYANQKGDPVTPKTSFDLGSVSKPITAMAIMKLSQQGLIDLEQPVVKYIPWFQSKDKSKSDRILVKHLLTHQSGFSNLLGNRNLNSDDNSREALKKSITELSQFELNKMPGSDFEYSNTNYHLLGYLLEVIEGLSYEEVIDNKIFAPLGMNNSYSQTKPKQIESHSQGFIYQFGSPSPTDYVMARDTLGSGGLFSSVQDIGLFLSDLLQQQSSLISDDIKHGIVSSIDKGSDYGYGFGWLISQKEGYRLLFHPGKSYGYEAVAAFSPELNIGFVVLANAHSGFGSRNVQALLKGIGTIILKDKLTPIASPLFETAILAFVYLIPLLIILFAVLFIKKYRQGSLPALSKPLIKSELVKRILLPSLCLLGLSYFLLAKLPSLFGIDLTTFALSEPTGFIGVILCASIATIWSLLRSVLLFKVEPSAA